MVKRLILIGAMILVCNSAGLAFAYGTIKGHFPPEQEPLRCAAFAYEVTRPHASPYTAPRHAVSCAPDGSFSMTLRPGIYSVAAGISLGGNFFATQPDPDRRIPIAGPQAVTIAVKDKGIYTISQSNAIRTPKNKSDNPPFALGPPAGKAIQITVTGKVFDHNGAPVSLAVVQLSTPGGEQPHQTNAAYLSAPTDAAGTYRIEQVEVGKYLVIALKFDPARGITSSPSPLVDLAEPDSLPCYDLVLSAPIYPAPLTPQPKPTAPAAVNKPIPAHIREPITDPASL